MNKILVTFVAFLFIGITIYPSVQANTNFEMVEVITEISGREGVKHVVTLTQDEVEEIKEIFYSMIEKAYVFNSIEEVTDILTDTILKLNKYGLLAGINGEEFVNFIEKYFKLTKIISTNINDENFNNFLCLFIGHTDEITLDLNIPFCLGEFIAQIAFIVEHLSFLLGRIFWIMCSMFILYGILKPLRFMNYISLSETSFLSIGLLGIKKGKDINLDHIFGYTGIKITFIYENAFFPPDEESFFLGTAISYQ